jgi:hypothetical protein
MEETTSDNISKDKIAETALVSRANPDRKVYGATAGKIRVMNQIPDDILNDKKLAAAIELLPSNYSFEIHKTVREVIISIITWQAFLLISAFLFRCGESAKLGRKE